jgi:glycerophosphoryl diester phosphodiesterase
MKEKPLRKLGLIVTVFVALSLFGAACKTGGQSALGETPSRLAERFYLIGHRGGAGLLPENTLAAFAGSLALGVDAIEMDARLTADGEVVMYHDSKLKPEITRTADGRWLNEPGPAIRNLTLRQLKSYDVGRLKPGTLYALRYPGQKPVDGERIPTLWEVIALVKRTGNNRVQLWIETKVSPLEPDLTPPPEVVADAVISMVRKAGVADRTVLQSFDWSSLVHAHKVAPEIATAYLSRQSGRNDTIQAGRPGTSPWTAGLDIDDFGGSVPKAVHAAGGQYWCPRYNQVDGNQIKEAHNLGLKVIVWTVNAQAAMRYLIDLGVDGIMTNRPDLLKEVLGQTD